MNGTGRFGKHQRLSGNKAFARVFAHRCSASNRFLVVYAAPNGLAFSRLGLSIGRKHGPATRRNKIKRRLREAFRVQQCDLPAGFDLVCVPRVGSEAGFDDLFRSLRTVSVRASQRASDQAGSTTM